MLSSRAILAAAPLVPAVAAGTFADEHISLIASLVATVTVVVGVIAWIDHRINGKLQAHEKREEKALAAHQALFEAELKGVRDLLQLHMEQNK